jgi:hypothetical protein
MIKGPGIFRPSACCRALRAPVVAAALLASLAGPAGAPRSEAAPPPRPAGKAKLETAVYDVSDLIYRPGGKTGYDSIDDVIKVVLTSVNPGGWSALDEDGDTLHELNGTKLEVRTNAARHAEIKQLLDALRGRMDVAVQVNVKLYEVERTFYEKEIKPHLGAGKRLASPVPEDLTERLAKRGTPLRSNQTRVANNRAAVLFSLRKAFLYAAKPADDSDPASGFATALYGVTLRTAVAVTPDRRSVCLKLTREVTDLAGIKKRTVTDPRSGEEVAVDVPELVKETTAATVQIDDGALLLMPVPSLPRASKAKDRVLLMVIEPRIYIEEEEKERSKQGPVKS